MVSARFVAALPRVHRPLTTSDMRSADAPAAKRAPLFTLSGVDGSGKSTQARLLAERIERHGVPAQVMHYDVDHRPGRVRLIELIAGRCAARSEAIAEDLVADAIVLDFFEYLAVEVHPVLRSGVSVVHDRYLWDYVITSNVAFAVNTRHQRRLLELVPEPDLAIWVDVDPCRAFERVTRRNVRPKPLEQVDVLEAKSHAYRIAQKDLQLTRFDGDGDPAHVADSIWCRAASLIQRYPGISDTDVGRS